MNKSSFDYRTTAEEGEEYQTVVRDERSVAHFVVRTRLGLRGAWFTKVYRCQPNGDFELEYPIECMHHGRCGRDRARAFHIKRVAELRSIS